jgi:hypothetical protein
MEKLLLFKGSDFGELIGKLGEIYFGSVKDEG